MAPPSFEGHGWLVVVNLAGMTAATVIAAMVVALLITDDRKHRHRDDGLSPVRVWRLIGGLFAMGIMLRCGIEAVNLWGGTRVIRRGPRSTSRPSASSIRSAVTFGVSGLALFVTSLPGMLAQLRKEPLPIDMWQSWPFVRRMLAVGMLTLMAAIGVVSTR